MFKGKLQYKEDFYSKSSDEDDADEGSADMIPQIIINAVETVKRKHLVEKGQTIVVTAGDPATNMTKTEGVVTNMLQVMEVY